SLTGAIAAVLLGFGGTEGGLRSLQVMAILVAAPFSVVMIAMLVALVKSLRADDLTLQRGRLAARRESLVAAVVDELGGRDTPENWPIESSPGSLRRRLSNRRRGSGETGPGAAPPTAPPTDG